MSEFFLTAEIHSRLDDWKLILKFRDNLNCNFEDVIRMLANLA